MRLLRSNALSLMRTSRRTARDALDLAASTLPCVESALRPQQARNVSACDRERGDTTCGCPRISKRPCCLPRVQTRVCVGACRIDGQELCIRVRPSPHATDAKGRALKGACVRARAQTGLRAPRGGRSWRGPFAAAAGATRPRGRPAQHRPLQIDSV